MSPSAKPHASGRGEFILVVDDAAINIQFLRTVFRNQGFRVEGASSGKEALARVAEEAPDLILLDIRMPGMDGYEVCRRLKENPATSHIPVVFISALTDPLDKVKAFSCGGVDYLNKPFAFQELLARVSTHLTISRLRAELKEANEALERKVRERTVELRRANALLRAEISERRQVENRLRTLSQAVEQSPVSVVITDPAGRIEYVNQAFERTSGYQAPEIMGKNPRILKSGKTPPSLYQEMWETILRGGSWRGELYNRRKDGTCYWERAHIAPVVDDKGEIRHFLGIKEDITLHKEQEERLRYQAHYDELTGLPNRLLALETLRYLLQGEEESRGRVAILFLDLDDFKKINDTLGHDIGDQVLVEAGRRLRRAVRPGDTVYRLGGDEFIVLLDELDDRDQARPVAENILAAFRKSFMLQHRDILLTTSIGVAIYPEDGLDASTLLRGADTAMYQAKREGRNTYRFFTESMNQEMVRRLTLEEELRGALERGEFSLCYQPLVDLSDRRVVGAEVLLRWNNPVLGPVGPDEFIPVAERTGLISPLGDFVIKQALEKAASWRCLDPRFRVAVNVSPRQFRDSGLVERITRLLARHGLPGEVIEIEITENLLMDNRAQVRETLLALHEAGIGLAMDDFGTGYSSLSYLRKYPFNTLKIDKSFIQGVLSDRDDRELVSAALTMAHNLGLTVVAEGVETEDQFTFLRERNCELAQGFLFDRPLPPEEFERLLVSPRDRDGN